MGNTKLSHGYEETVDSASKLYFALHAAKTFSGARSENVGFAWSHAEGDCVSEARGIGGRDCGSSPVKV